MFSFASYADIAADRIKREYRFYEDEWLCDWSLHLDWRCEWALEEVDEFDPRAVIAALREELEDLKTDPYMPGLMPTALPVIFNIYGACPVGGSFAWRDLAESGELTTNAAAIVETVTDEVHSYVSDLVRAFASDLGTVVSDLENEWLGTN